MQYTQLNTGTIISSIHKCPGSETTNLRPISESKEMIFKKVSQVYKPYLTVTDPSKLPPQR